jgi:hypothetical protein
VIAIPIPNDGLTDEQYEALAAADAAPLRLPPVLPAGFYACAGERSCTAVVDAPGAVCRACLREVS